MFQQLSIGSHQVLSRLVLFTSLLGLLTVFSAWLSKTSAPEAGAAASTTQVKSTQLRENSMPSLQGTQARDFLQQQAQYESLMQAVTAVRFGLKPYDVDPFDSSRKNGYLGMSHVQNLNVWFDEDGATIRPRCMRRAKRKAWSFGMRLEAYGYGGQLIAAPSIVSQTVKDNRIEYQHCRLPIANCRFEAFSGLNRQSDLKLLKGQGYSSSVLQSAMGNRQSAITEWYEKPRGGHRAGIHAKCATGSRRRAGRRAAAVAGET
jgi:hypothetical protein